MEIRFATKMDINGNRYYLTINTEKQEFSRRDYWYNKYDFVTITKTEMRKMIANCRDAGYKETVPQY